MAATTTPPPGRELLEGKVVLVTAAAGTGIGYATAQRCLEEGATVVLSDAHERRLADAADGLSELARGTAPRSIVCDVTDEAQVQAMIGETLDGHGRLDVLVNNAGLGGTADLVDMTDEQWDRVLDISLTGTMRCMRAALRHMYDAGGGVIVNNASVMGWRAQAGQSHYAAAKAGVMALTRCAAIEAAPHGVRINAVAPSLAMHAFLSKVTTDELLEELTEREAFGRAAEPWEVATVIAFLASDYSTYMTGEVVSVSSQRVISFATLDELRDAAGRHLGWTDWIDITQERVNLFADATGDHQWIHVDVDRANAESPFGGPIAHGFLTLSLSNLFLPQLIEVPGASAGVNYGTGKVRFPSPVPVGCRVRAGAEITGVEEIPAGLQTTIAITIEVEGQTKPACVIESISRWLA